MYEGVCRCWTCWQIENKTASIHRTVKKYVVPVQLLSLDSETATFWTVDQWSYEMGCHGHRNLNLALQCKRIVWTCEKYCTDFWINCLHKDWCTHLTWIHLCYRPLKCRSIVYRTRENNKKQAYCCAANVFYNVPLIILQTPGWVPEPQGWNPCSGTTACIWNENELFGAQSKKSERWVNALWTQ